MKRQMWIVIAALLLGSPAARALDDPAPGGPGLSWQQLSPEQQQKLRARYERFKSLPPEEQQRLRENFRRYRDLPPEQREQLRQR